ncbi:hypothetical protein BJ978_001065 [Agromyces terreus]|uniref:Uncharacterized protein n=1 Tax=Agromyces terreus TaxID=424795 RepID=A0A9X2KBA4_9MICO|nr:hypothetical protein [Agromyces terreus]MCP2370389.1 hypothetical protein [Agromyces terreus]
MSRNPAYDELIWAMATGVAVTSDQVDLARQGAADLSALADDVSAGAFAYLPCEPEQWRSEAGDAYGVMLGEARSSLCSAAAVLADAAQALSSDAWRLEGRLVEQNAILAAGPGA